MISSYRADTKMAHLLTFVFKIRLDEGINKSKLLEAFQLKNYQVLMDKITTFLIVLLDENKETNVENLAGYFER